MNQVVVDSSPVAVICFHVLRKQNTTHGVVSIKQIFIM